MKYIKTYESLFSRIGKIFKGSDKTTEPTYKFQPHELSNEYIEDHVLYGLILGLHRINDLLKIKKQKQWFLDSDVYKNSPKADMDMTELDRLISIYSNYDFIESDGEVFKINIEEFMKNSDQLIKMNKNQKKICLLYFYKFYKGDKYVTNNINIQQYQRGNTFIKPPIIDIDNVFHKINKE